MNKVSTEYISKPILSKLVRANGVPQVGEEVHMIANEQQRTALARLNKLAEVKRLEARLTAKPCGKELHVRGAITADVVYTCVRTLEPFSATIIEKVDVMFAPPETGKHHRHVDLSFGDSTPEALIDGQADIGALVQEFFQLALDPYPHKPGANFADNEILSSPARPKVTRVAHPAENDSK
jgi:uncharacterized metal-binding protein YceD (DUF177 family)